MSHELHYTSVPRGLKPGSRGFCTVGLTPQMPGPLVDRLEGLSGYQPVFPPHDPSAALNPIVFSHLRLTINGKMMSVLSRIGPAGLDYSGRPNKYAHHVVVDGNERPEGGPAWLLSQPGFMQGTWDGEPREISVGRVPAQGDRPPGMARAWQALTGDGGWAGVLAESFLADARRTVFLVFRPGMDLLPLFVEALALLPAQRRWDVDFSTYFNQLPQGLTCAWRGVLEGSDEARNATRLPGARVVDLCGGLGRAEGGGLVHFARTGERLAHEPTTSIIPPAPGRHIPRMPHEPTGTVANPFGETRMPQPRATSGSYDLAPELARLMPGTGSNVPYEKPSLDRNRRTVSWVLVSAVFAACTIILLAAIFFLSTANVRPRIGLGSETVAEAVEKVSRDKKLAEPAIPKVEPRDEVAVDLKKPEPIAPSKEENKAVKAVASQTPAATNEQRKEAQRVADSEKPMPPPIPKLGRQILFRGMPPTPGRKSLLPNVNAAMPPDAASVESANHVVQRKYLKFSAILNFSSDFQMPELGHSTLQLKTTTPISQLGESIGVAIIRLKDESVFSFQWDGGLEQSRRKDELADAVRDFVLKIRSKEGGEDYLLLRDPKPRNSDQPFDLKNVGGQKPDHVQKRHRTFIWADQQDALVGTKWKIGIRRWKIVNRLAKDGPERTIAAGDCSAGQMKDETKDSLNDGDVEIFVRVSREQRGTIQVGLHFNSGRIAAHDEMRNRLFRDYQIRGTRPSEKSAVTSVQIHHCLKELASELQNESTKFHDIPISTADREELKRIVEKEILYNFIDKSEASDLSLIVGLELDDRTVLDIAQIGKFADSKP